ncbi:hypothetical protein ACOSQ3_019972 [Xanthoceras sorbifolium]
MDTTEVERLCEALSLAEPNRPTTVLKVELQEVGRRKLDLCLAGHLLATKQANRDAFRVILPKIWQTTQEVENEVLRDNIFGFHFKNRMDRRRVLNGRPWSFDRSLLVLEEPRAAGELSSLAQIGTVREVDAGASADCLGKYIRVRVEIDIDKLLQRFLKVNLGSSAKDVVMLLRYERLPEYCFKCGMVGHSIRECDCGSGLGGRGKDEAAYGLWMRAASPASQWKLLFLCSGATPECLMAVVGDAGTVGKVDIAGGRRWKRRARALGEQDIGMGQEDIGGKRPRYLVCVDSDLGTKRSKQGDTRCCKIIMEECWKEIYWRRRSRVTWLRKDDRNTKFFHSQASNRKKINSIKGLQDSNGTWQEGSGYGFGERLRLVLGEIISKTQSAFIPGRSIFDNAMVGFKCIHALKRKRKGNEALLGKQCWRLIQDLSSLAARVLKGCYFPSSTLLKARSSGLGSFVWKSIIWGKELVSKGSRWRIGSGASVLVYHDRWISRPSTFKIISPPSLDFQVTVDLLKTSEGAWDVNLLREHFLQVDVDAILSLPSSSFRIQDSFLWHFEKSGFFSVRSSYHTALAARHLPIPLKVKLFIWRFAHDWLHAMTPLAARGLILNVSCLMCRIASECWFRRNRAVHGQLLLPVGEVLAWFSSFLAEYQAAGTRPPSTSSLTRSMSR